MEMQDAHSKQIALDALAQVGDPDRGEWIERGHAGPLGASVWHVRRRLSVREEIAAGLSVIDMRRTDAGAERLRKLCAQFPHLKPIAIRIGEMPGPREGGASEPPPAP